MRRTRVPCLRRCRQVATSGRRSFIERRGLLRRDLDEQLYSAVLPPRPRIACGADHSRRHVNEEPSTADVAALTSMVKTEGVGEHLKPPRPESESASQANSAIKVNTE